MAGYKNYISFHSISPQLRHEIQEHTEDVRARSVIAEERWIMGDDNNPPSVISMLTTLDEHNFYTAQQGML